MGPTALLLLVVSAAPEWTKLEIADGIEIFARELPNERFAELRLVTTSSASVASLCDAAFGTSNVEAGEPSIVARKLISLTRNGDVTERVTYEQAAPPVVSARDFALKAKKEVLAPGSCRLTFSADNAEAPPLPPGFVRIEKLRGSWQFEAVGSWTRITYTIFTDPGGSVPPVFIHGSLKSTAVDWVKFVIRRATRNA